MYKNKYQKKLAESIKKRMDEAGGQSWGMSIEPTPQSKPFSPKLEELFDISVNGLIYGPVDNSVHLPWDGDITVSGNKLIIVGSVSSSGRYPDVVLTAEIPIDEIRDIIDIQLEFDDEQDYNEAVKELQSLGWKVIK